MADVQPAHDWDAEIASTLPTLLNLELLAYNFHESLDLAPLFKHVRARLRDQQEGRDAELR